MEETINNIKEQLNLIKSVADAIGLLYMSMDGLIARYNYSKDDALETKLDAERFVKNNACKILYNAKQEIEKSLNEINPNVNQLPF